MSELGIGDGSSVIDSEGGVESASEGITLGAAGAGATRNTKSSASEYCTSCQTLFKVEDVGIKHIIRILQNE